MKYFRAFSNPMGVYVVLTVLFFVLLVLLPANRAVMATYNLSSAQYHILLFAVELPLAAIWFTAFFGYKQLRGYATTISKTREGKGFNDIANGFQWMAIGYIVPSLVSLCLNAISNGHPGFHQAAIITANYCALIFPVVAFSIMASGAYRLTSQTHIHLSIKGLRALVASFVAFGVLYCYLTFQRLDLNTHSSVNPYFLKPWLVAATLVVPYLYAWFMGLFAAYNVALLGKHAKGVLYRQAIRLLAAGVIITVASSIAAQCIRFITPRVGHLSLNATLIIIYLLYTSAVGGFMLIVMGASRLKRIEEV